MSAVKRTSVSQTRKVSDPVFISRRTRIASSSPRSTTPPSPASSSSTALEEDEIDKHSVTDTSEPNPILLPEIAKTPKRLLEPCFEEKNLQVVDMNTFRQILDLDEDGDHEFSLSMVNDYIKQAEDTLQKLDKSFKDKNLSELYALGHFFKGSSAAIGLAKVQASCEKIQHYGVLRDEEAKRDLTPGEALDKIKNQLAQLREEYAEAKKTLQDWFCEHEDED